jgi:hypothetical protein
LAQYSNHESQRSESPVSPDGKDSPPLANGWKNPASGLSALAERYLGKPLDKSQQLSDWERRPLHEEQMIYAGVCSVGIACEGGYDFE